MRKKSDFYFKIVLVVLDILALLSAFTIAYILRISLDPRPFHISINAIDFITSIFMTLPLWIAMFYFFGLYDREIYTHPLRNFGRILLASITGIMIMISVTFFTNTPLFPAKLVAGYATGIGFILLMIFRSAANIVRLRLLKRGLGARRVILIGNCDLTHVLADFIETNPLTGFKISGIVAQTQFIPIELKKLRRSSLESALTRDKIDVIIQTDSKNVSEHYQIAQKHYLDFYQAPEFDGIMTTKHTIDIIDSVPLIHTHPTPLMGYGRIVKRIMDIIGGTIGIVIASPIMLLVAIAVKISDPAGPILMHGKQQKRLTRYNRPFKVYKFRSHYAKFDGKTDEEVFRMVGKPELIEEYRKNGDKLDHDFRVTPVGRFIRRFSLDELPQLFNVVKGDISLVGPRALVPHELSAYDKKHVLLAVKSGFTGLAVVSGRRSISFEERRRIDLYYVQNWSIWMDITILLKTCLVIFQKDN